MQQIQGVSILKNLDKCNNFFLKTAKYTVLLHCCAVLQLHIWSNVLRFFVLQCCSCICGLKFCAFFMMPLQPQGLYSFFIHSSALIMSTHNSTEKLTPSRKCKSLTLLQKAKIKAYLQANSKDPKTFEALRILEQECLGLSTQERQIQPRITDLLK